MASQLRFEGKKSLDPNCLKENVEYLSEHQYLKTCVPLRRHNACPVPLDLRRSVSLEDTLSNENNNLNNLQDSTTQNSLNTSLGYSVQSLCFRLRPHQLLPEYNRYIAKADNEHQFDWWTTAEHLRPLLENIILYEKFQSYFEDDQNQQDEQFILFKKSKRNQRRDAVCFGIDKLCYNEQMILFVAISNEVQIEYNLMSSGFKI